MTIQTVPKIWLPGLEQLDNSSVAGSTAITASGHKIAFTFHAPKTGTISAVGFRAGTISGTASLDVRVETVSSGRASGTLLGTNSNGASGTIVSNTSYETSLTTGVEVTKGDLIAVVFAYSAGTSISLTVCSNGNSFASMGENFPGLFVDVGSGYVATASRSPNFVLKYNDGSYEVPLGCKWTPTATVSSTYSSGEAGLRFRFPMKCRVTGAWFFFDPDTALAVSIYTDTGANGASLGTQLITKSMASTDFENTNAGLNVLTFASTVTLDANTWYRYSIGVSGASSRYNYIDVPANAQLAGQYANADGYLTVWNGSAWSDTTTRVPQMGLIIDGLDDGLGAGAKSASGFII